MACPFFAPSHRLEFTGWARPPRFPLGDAFRGACHALPSVVFEPPEAHQREVCNCGYARGRCDRFPHGSAGDAVRFSVTGQTSSRLSMIYVVEKDHAPAEHGTLEFALADLSLAGPPIGDVLAQQARAFVESYLNYQPRAQAAG